MKKYTGRLPKVNCLQERRLVTAVRQALPYIFGLSLGLSALPSSANLSSDTTAAFTATQLVRQFTLKNTVAQVSQGMQGYIAEVNGQQRAPDMGARPLDFPSDMGTIPTGLNLPQRDGAGRLLGYCAWDNTATTSTAAHNAGQGVTNPLVYAVVSPGLNGTMQTTCASVLATGSGVGDDYVQVVAPMKVSSASYKSSVATFADLPAGEQGDVRLVRDTNTLYSFNGVSWEAVSGGGGQFADDSATNGAGAISYTTGKVTVADFQATAATLTGVLNGTSATFSGAVTANTLIGNGSGLTDLNASNLASGTVSAARGGTGVDASAAGNGTLLIGNGSGFTLGTIAAGAGISVLNSAGAITISNNGVVSIAGTANQVIASASNGAVTLSLPQAIATTSTPTFAGMMLNGDLVGSTATFSGAVSAARLNVGDNTGVILPNLVIGNGAVVNAQDGGGANTVLGINGLSANSTGTVNTAVGYLSMQSNTTGNDNLSAGALSLYNNTTGSQNTAVGKGAMYLNSSGGHNVGVGYDSLLNNTTGSYNTALGALANVSSGALTYAAAIGAGSTVATSNTLVLGRNSTTDQVVIGSDSRNNTYANTKLYVNGVTNLNGDLRGTTATFSGAVTANSFSGNGSALTNLNAGNISSGTLPVARGGTGISTAASNGQLLIGNGTGFTLGTLTGTANQINVVNGPGAVTLSLPQNIATTSTPTFGGLTLNGALVGSTATFSGAVSAARLNVGDSTGVTQPNLVIGNGAMVNAQNGGGANTVLGINGLSANSTGTVNTAVGYLSMQSNTTGNDNLSAGALSLYNNTTGSQNTAVGKGAMYFNSTGVHNVGVGYDTLLNNTTGSYNTALGSLANVSSGALTYATAIGAGSTVATSNTLVLGRNGTTDQVVIGANTRNDIFTNTRLYVAGGISASRQYLGDSTGVDLPNIVIGNGAVVNAQDGVGANIVLGINAMSANSTGAVNTSVGYSSLQSNLTGSNNLSAGGFSLFNNTSGSQNTAVGKGAMYLNSTGGHNVGVGYDTLLNNTTGSNNTAVGALADVITGALTYATAIGAGSTVATSDTIALGRNSVADQVVIGTNSRSGGHKLYVVGSGLFTGTVTASSDIRLKNNVNALDVETMLSKLGQIGVYSYNYNAHPELGKKVGVIAQELQNLFPEVANYGSGDKYLSVDYGALGAMAAVGVGQLNNKFTLLNKTVNEQGEKLLELGGKVEKHDARIAVLESWKTDAVARMDGMQSAIDLNIQKIADHAVAIQTNTKAIERLDDALITLDEKVKGNTDAIGRINERWARNFSASDDGSLLTVNAVELKVSNFSAGQVRAEALYSKRLEAEMARIAELEVNNLRANTAVANAVQAEQVNTGSAQVYAGVGMPALLFAAKSDGHYTVSTSALDGSYATATVIVNAGQAQIVPAASKGIELIAVGNMVKVVAAGKSIKATWIKMG